MVMTRSHLLLLAVSAVGTAQNTSLWPTHSYKSSNATPPILSITTSQDAACDLAPGYLFFAPDGVPALNPNTAPYIMDPNSPNGDLIWAGPHQHAFSFGVYTYRGDKVLAAWNGTVFPEPVGRGNGMVQLWNQHYEIIAEVKLPGNFAELTPGARYPSNVDLHEIYITERNTMLVTGNNVTQTDLSSVGGPKNGWIVEAQFYEIDIASNEVLWSWKSLDHLDSIPLTASVYPLGSEGYTGETQEVAWGYFHPNSIAPYPGGGYIVSARYICSVIVLAPSGEVLWRLFGRDLPEETSFCYQHDARVISHQTDEVVISIHDNHNCPIDQGHVPTSAKLLSIDPANLSATTLLHAYQNLSGPIYSTAQGSVQLLPFPTNNLFTAHGWVPVFQELSLTSGAILQTIQFGHTPVLPGGGFNSSAPANVTLSYRAFKEKWVGCPLTRPDVVVEEGRRVYVSWNGATEVEGWEVFDVDSGECIGRSGRKGFETVIDLEVEGVKYVQVKAVMKTGACGRNGVSEVVAVQ